MRLTFTISLTVIAILAFAIGVTSFLNYYKYQSTLSSLVRSRVVVIGLDLKNAIDANVALGIPLSQTANIQEVIARAKAKDKQIVGIDVVEWSAGGGSRLFGTDKTSTTSENIAAWQKASNLADGDVWKADDKTAFVTGFSLVNGFGRKIGAVVVQASRSYQAAKTERIFHEIGRTSLLALAAAAALTFTGVFLLFRRISTRFERMSRSLEQILDGNPPEITEQNAASEQEKQFVHFQNASADVLAVVGEGRRLLATPERPE